MFHTITARTVSCNISLVTGTNLLRTPSCACTHMQSGITMGAEYSGPSVSTDVPLGGLGSKDTMERTTVVKTGITAGADYSGPSVDDNSSVVQAALGSFGIMDVSACCCCCLICNVMYSVQSIHWLSKSSHAEAVVLLECVASTDSHDQCRRFHVLDYSVACVSFVRTVY
jgi:hypothetical protein